MAEAFLRLFPADMRAFWAETAGRKDQLSEIRLRAGRPVLLYEKGREWTLDRMGRLSDRLGEGRCFSEAELSDILSHLCQDSIYAFEEEIRRGFLTVAGGHRIGLAGQVVLEDGQIRTMRYIRFLNIRIAHQIVGAADALFPWVCERGRAENTLLVSPPGCGKTTMLRDLVRHLSDAGEGVCVIDERSEIAGSYLGVPQNDVGLRTDVLDACPKALGMMVALRAMAPQILAVDEIGEKEDIRALRRVSACGVRILATMHGQCREDIPEELYRIFDCFIVLGRENGAFCIREKWRRL